MRRKPLFRAQIGWRKYPSSPTSKTGDVVAITQPRVAKRCTPDLPPYLPYRLEIRKSAILWRMTDMKRSRYSEEHIIGFLKQAEAGMPVKDLCRKEGFSDGTSYKWRAKFGGMDSTDAKWLRELESENAKLKKLLAEAHLDISALKGVFGVKS